MKRVSQHLWIVCILIGFFTLAGTLKAILPQTLIGSWRSASVLSQARANATAALLPDGRILMVGGDGVSGPLQSVEVFATDGTISSVASMNVARSHHFAVVLSDGRVLVGGGTAGGGGTTNSAEIYDPATDSWTQTSAMTSARANASAALLQDGRVVIVGGDDAGTPNNTIEIYDPVSGSFSFAGTLSSPRTMHAMATLQDGRVLIVGGFDGTNPLASSDIFDPSTGNISGGPSLTVARYRHSATTLLDGTVVIVGGVSTGSNGTVELASAEVFDPTAGAVSTLGTNLVTARQGHQAFLLPNNNNVLIVGGTSAGVPVAASELFSPWQGTFAATGANVTPRSAAAGSAMQQDGLLLTAGGNDASGNTLASTELYAFPVVKTDASDYAPGSIVTITGSGWQPGETVTLTFLESPLIDTPPTLTVVADGNGNFVNTQFSPDLYDVNIRFYLTAVGSQSGLQAQNTFTDSNIGTVTVGAQSPSPVNAGSNATFLVTVNFTGNTTTCNVTFTTSGLPAGASGSAPGVSGASNNTPKATTLTVTTGVGVAAGTYSFTVTAVAGSGCQGGSSTSSPATLSVQNTTSLSTGPITAVFGQAVNLSATLTSGSPVVGENGQTINFTLNGNAAGSATTNSSGTATRSSSLGSIAPGTYASGVGASFTTNGPILGSTASAQLVVNQAGTTTTITAPNLNPATSVGQPYTVSWTVAPVAPGSGTPTGTVSVSDGTDSCSAAVGAGSCSLTSNTAGSPKTLTATYSGDPNFIGSSGTKTHNVSQVAATTAVSSSQNPSVFGQSVTFTANVTGAGAAPSGTIQFVVDGSNFGSPVALVAGSASSGPTTSLTVAGSPHTVTAQYGGDANYSNGSGSLTGGQTVNKASTTALITADAPDPSVVGQTVPVHYSVSVTAPGSGTPTGNVQVTDGVDSCTGTVAAGQCNLTLNTAGARSLTATYQGDPNFSASPASAVEPHQVNPAGTTTAVTLTAGTNPSVFGQALTFTATVTAVAPGSGTPAGTVNFYDGGSCATPGNPIASNVALNGSGQAAGSTSSLAVSGSPYSVLACYAGTANYNASSATVAQTVNKANTTAAITSDQPDPSTTAQQITVKYTVSVTAPGSGTPTGNVQVTDGTNNCTGTVAAGQCNLTLTTAGTRTLTATYQGDPSFNASPASAGATHTVLTPATIDVLSPVTANQQGAPADLIVKAGDVITVVVPLKNNGGSDAQSITPPTLVVNHTGTATATCGAGAGAPQVMSGQTHNYTYTCSSVSGDGTLTFIANGSTASGMDATSSQAITGAGTATSNSITVDDTQPVMGLSPANGTYNVPFSFNWAITDPTAGAVSSGVNASTCLVKVDGITVSTACSGSSPITTGGAHSVVVSASDLAGNAASDTRSYTVIVDNKPPVITVSFSSPDGQNGWFVHSPVTGTVSADDSTTGNSNITAISCTDGVNPIAVSGAVFGSSTASGAISVSGDGTHSISCTATDSASNTGAFAGSTAMPVTVKIDATAPALTVTRLTAANGNGWNNSDVTVQLSCTDSGSGVASLTASGAAAGTSATSPLDVIVTTEGAAQSVSGACTDAAGNSAAQASVSGINIDKTKPTASAAASPGANAHNWNNTDVTVTFTGSDSLSGIDFCTTATTLSGEGAGQSASGTCTDKAGNVSATATASGINIDKTPPTLAFGAPAPTPNMNGWNNTDVSFGFSASDNLSGVDTTNPAASPLVLTSEGAAVTGTVTVTDLAGNTATFTSPAAKIDKTPPSITGSPSPAANANGWNNSDVTVSFTCSDSLSGLAGGSPPSPTILSSEGAGQSANGTCIDLAGNSANAAVNGINIDKTSPTASAVRTPAANTYGWNNTDVTVSFTGSDSLSGIASCDPDVVLTSEGAGQSASGTCKDKAGNVSAPSAITGINIDKTPPTISFANRTPANGNGWNNTDITVNWNCGDALSGPVNASVNTTISAEGAAQSANGTCTDKAGNTASNTQTGINIDKTPPTITGSRTPAANGAGWNNTSVTASYIAGDTLSGLDASSPASGNFLFNTEGQSQSHTFTVTDLAGNSASATISSVNIDLTPPTISFVSRTPANGYGWNNTDVSLNWSCSDGLSGPVAPGVMNTLSGEGGNQSSTATCLDLAGNFASNTQNNINIDKTPPTLNPTVSPSPVILNGTATASAGATDGLSGIATSSCGSPVVNVVGPQIVSCTATDKAGNSNTASANYNVLYATGGICAGDVGHAIRQPINSNGSSVFKLGSTVPTKFAVCDAHGVSISTASLVKGYGLLGATSSPSITVDEDVYSTTPDTAFRWDPTGQQWIFNQATKNNGTLNQTGVTYFFGISLNDGSWIYFQYGLK